MSYFTDQNGPKGGRAHENEIWVFLNSETNITNRSEKEDEKNGVICLVSMFPFWLMVLKLSKKCIFCNFVLTSGRNLIQAIYIYASERSRYTLSENGIVYYAMTYCFEDISVWSRIILLNFCWLSIFLDILIANISLTVARTPINYTIIWKSVMRTFICIYINCLRDFI